MSSNDLAANKGAMVLSLSVEQWSFKVISGL